MNEEKKKIIRELLADARGPRSQWNRKRDTGTFEREPHMFTPLPEESPNRDYD